MSELNIFTEGTQKKILDELRIQNSLVKVIASGWNIDDFQTVQELVRGGGGPRYFPVGTQFAVPHSAYGGGTIVFDVVDHDGYKNPNDTDAHTMTLLMHDCIYGRMVDAPEMLWANTGESAIPTGTYSFTLYKGSNGGQTYEDGTYQFTIARPIPAGGGWTHSKVGNWYATTDLYVPANIIGNYVTTYDADGAVLETSIAVTSGSGGTNLGTASNAQVDCVNTIGTFNNVMRRAYGSNHWGESAIRQWLNSAGAANAWWQRQTIFDMPASYANVAGFLNGIDPAFLSIVGEVDVVTAYNTVYNIDGIKQGTYTTRDKFFLASRVELGYGSENGISEGSVFEYYNGATSTDRIKYDIAAETTARHWWVRSPNPFLANYVRIVHPDGSLHYNGAHSGTGAAAACVIY